MSRSVLGATPPQRSRSTDQPSTQWKSAVSLRRDRADQAAWSSRSGLSTSPSTVTSHCSGET